jgi:hypothetical protein
MRVSSTLSPHVRSPPESRLPFAGVRPFRARSNDRLARTIHQIFYTFGRPNAWGAAELCSARTIARGRA